MPDGVLEGMVREFLACRMPQSIFCWQGGEPTVAGLDFFRRVVELQVKHGGRGQVVGNAFQTNGVLIDRSWAQLMADYRFLVGLSLDGPREVHEEMRGHYCTSRKPCSLAYLMNASSAEPVGERFFMGEFG